MRPGPGRIQGFTGGQIFFSCARYASHVVRQNVTSMNLPRRVVSISPQDSNSFKWCESVAAVMGNATRRSEQAAQDFAAMHWRISKRRGSERAREMASTARLG